LKITIVIATILSLCAISFLVYGSSGNPVNFTVYAQSYLQTIKYKNLVIDLGNGVKTDAQLILLLAKDHFLESCLSMEVVPSETLGYVHDNGPKPPTPFSSKRTS
jgi:hypothetical protein